MTRARRGATLAALLVAFHIHAFAHDTWFSPSRTPAARGNAAVELSTGNRYPVQEFNPGAASLVRSGCSDGAARELALRPGGDQPKWLPMAARAQSAQQPVLACWAELKPFELVMEPAKVEVYFREIRANARHREAWAGMQARQLPWRESYRKFARIELPSPAGSTLAAARRPVGMDLELVVVGDESIAAGQPLVFQLLRDGQPLADFPLELVSERNALGIWRQTDNEGLVRHTLPFGGRWLLRGTDLRLSPQDPDRWESRFVTLAFEAP